MLEYSTIRDYRLENRTSLTQTREFQNESKLYACAALQGDDIKELIKSFNPMQRSPYRWGLSLTDAPHTHAIQLES